MKKKITCLFFLIFITSTFSQNIDIPDPVFKAKLLLNGSAAINAEGDEFNTKADLNGDGEIQVSEATSITGIKVGSFSGTNPIQSIAGIENFTNLKVLGAYNLELTSVDLSALTQLKALILLGNDIESIDLANNINLESVNMAGNQLTVFDTTVLPLLAALDVSGNNLTTVEVPAAILELNISDNQFTSLDLTNAPNLAYLDISYNLFTEIDCSATAVDNLFCGNNPNLTHINIQNGVISYYDTMPVYSLNFENLPSLTHVCIDIDEASALGNSQYQYQGTENVTIYTGENCDIEVDMNSSEVFSANSVNVSPNPFKDIIAVSTDAVITTAEVYDISGRLVVTPRIAYNANTLQFDLSQVSQSGVYFLKLYCGEKVATQKIIKQ